MTESSRVAAMPPCTVPRGLAKSGRVASEIVTLPWSTSSRCVPSSWPMLGIWVGFSRCTHCSNSNPVIEPISGVVIVGLLPPCAAPGCAPTTTGIPNGLLAWQARAAAVDLDTGGGLHRFDDRREVRSWPRRLQGGLPQSADRLGEVGRDLQRRRLAQLEPDVCHPQVGGGTEVEGARQHRAAQLGAT